jgi:hypothetical protein
MIHFNTKSELIAALPAMNTLLDYYNFFKAIPSNKWCKYKLTNDKGCHCARGHLGTRLYSYGLIESPKAIKFYELTDSNSIVISSINDGVNPRFQQPRPKSRILAYIKSKL